MRITSVWGRFAVALWAAALCAGYVFAVVKISGVSVRTVPDAYTYVIQYFLQACTSSNSGVLRSAADGSAYCIEFWLNRYQTLIGAALALGGAFLAFSAVRQQIAQAERHAADKEKRDSNAARAVVTHALSKLNGYASGCVRALKSCRPTEGQHFARGRLHLPEFPEEVIPVLQDAVRYSDPPVAAQFADLIAQTQVQKARIESAVNKSNDSEQSDLTFTELQDRIIDAMDMYARTEILFDYGRHFMNRGLVTAGDLRGSLLVFELDAEEWPRIDLRLKAQERAEAGRTGT